MTKDNVSYADFKRSNEDVYKRYKLAEGLYIYKDKKNSNNYIARIWSRKEKTYISRSTSVATLKEAKQIAYDYFTVLLQGNSLLKVKSNQTFSYWSNKLIEIQDKKVANNDYAVRTNNDEMNRLYSAELGLSTYFDNYDLSKLNTAELNKYFEWRESKAKALSDTSKNKFINLVNKIMRLAYESDAVSNYLPIKSHRRKTNNPRSAFKFNSENNEYKKLLNQIRTAIENKIIVRGQLIDEELYFVVMFIMHSFVRPTINELFSIKHKDISIRNDIKSLNIEVYKGKTGYRVSSSMQFLVDIYENLKEFHENYREDDFIFRPEMKNREYAFRTFSRQFTKVLEDGNLLKDESNRSRTLYSLRHTSLQMRITKSKNINLLFLAQNAGTSVDMLERFYARQLPKDKSLISNLQSFQE